MSKKGVEIGALRCVCLVSMTQKFGKSISVEALFDTYDIHSRLHPRRSLSLRYIFEIDRYRCRQRTDLLGSPPVKEFKLFELQ